MTHSYTRKLPARRDGFSWARIPQQDGGVLYRLYRRDMRGVLHATILPYPVDADRTEIARELRLERHRLRNAVDEIDLEIMGLTDR